MIHILYIATPSSIHDIKWITYFSMQKDKYKVYAVGEKQNNKDYQSVKEALQQSGISLLPPIDTFSITSPIRTLKAISTLRSYISSYSIDLVHILFATPHGLWANYINIPYIITTRGSDALIVLPSLQHSKGLRSLYDGLLLKLFKKALRKAKVNTSTSEAQAEKLKEILDTDNVEIIRTGVDVDRIAESKDKSLMDASLIDKRFVLSPRFMSPLYNIELQIDAISYLPKNILEDYTFVYIRGKSYETAYYARMQKKLEALAKSHQLKYIIKEYLGQEELWTYYNHATLTVMTPISDGTPNSALEAMAARCPLIMPALPYDKFIFDNVALILQKNDPKELADLVMKALTAYPAEMTELGYLRVYERGNRNIEMNKLEKLYT